MKKSNDLIADIGSKINLTEKQSVRTTFKLTKKSIDAINWLIEKYDTKPKEIFDIMCSNENLIKTVIEYLTNNNNFNNSNTYIRKTFVISKLALRSLNAYSKKNKIARDLIVDNLIFVFEHLLKKIEENERKQEEKALSIISNFWGEAEKIEKELKTFLEDEHPILTRFSYVIVLLMNLTSAIKSKLEEGIPIDPDDFSQS